MTLYADIAGERLDAFLARQAEGLSRSAAQKLIEDGLVTRNGKPGKKNDKLNLGDEIVYAIPEPKEVDIVNWREQKSWRAFTIALEKENLLALVNQLQKLNENNYYCSGPPFCKIKKSVVWSSL